MDRSELNAPGFHYKVSYKRRDAPPGVIETTYVTHDWRKKELIVEDQEPFKEYVIYVQAINDEGPATESFLEKKIGYSGQDCESLYSLTVI